MPASYPGVTATTISTSSGTAVQGLANSDTVVRFSFAAGTFAGFTGVFEASTNGTDYYPTRAFKDGDGSAVTGTVTLTDDTAVSYTAPGAGCQKVQFRATARTSGSVVVSAVSGSWFTAPLAPLGSVVSGGTFTGATFAGATLTGITILGDTSNPLYERATTRLHAQPTPTAETATTQTWLAAELLTGIITSTQTGAVTATLDTGANLDTALTGAINNDSIDYAIVNLGSASGAVTVTASSGHTIVGNPVVAIATSATFRSRRTGTNTWVCYRLNG